MNAPGFVACALAALVFSTAAAHAATPLAGHYPPGQSGIRGAATPPVGWAYTNFNRAFSNLEARDGGGAATGGVDEVRYANISMFTWATSWRVLGMRYGALAGIPFSTGNLNPSDTETGSTSLGLGDVLLTPISLYGVAPAFDYQLQFTLWSASGRFEPGGTDNRGSGFPALVYSLGGVWYPDESRTSWSVSGVARFEQNLEQADTDIDPGDDVVFDWGAGKVLSAWSHPLDAGVSGFATWQLSDQEGGATTTDEGTTNDLGRYRNFGLGPEASLSVSDAVALRLRLHWEFGTRNAVQGNNVWLIANVRM